MYRSLRSRRRARAIAAIAAAAALLALLYLAIVNGVLAAELRSIARTPGVELRHENAYTLYPGRIHIQRLEVRERGARRWGVEVDRADLRMSLPGLLGGTRRVAQAEADVRAFHIGDHEVTGRMPARVEGAVLGRDQGSLRAASLVVAEGAIRREGLASSPAQLRGWVAVRGATWSERGGVELTGALHLESDDAGALLDVALLPEAARWALEGLRGQAVTADADIEVRGDTFTLRDLRASGEAAEVRGTLRRRGGVHDGAFLVRRGRWTTGLEISEGRVTVVLSPDDGWLSRKAGLPAPP